MSDRGWRKVPAIQEAKRVTQALGATAAIILYINEEAGSIGLATYGTTGPRCTTAGKWGDVAYDALLAYLEAQR